MVGTFLHFARASWWVWALLALAWIVKTALEIRRQRRLSRSGIDEIDRMDGRAFEEYLATLFRRLGYPARVTPYRGDYGADLIVERDGSRIAVQAKCWGRRVGIKAVQEAQAAKALYGCSEAMVVTNRAFTDQARRLAEANGVELWDRDVLVAKLLHPSATTAPSDDCCATCGVQVSEKVLQYCRAHSARFGGNVYCFKHQRSAPQPPPASASA
jgi:restriction system protein